jgi:hypothetical protein
MLVTRKGETRLPFVPGRARDIAGVLRVQAQKCVGKGFGGAFSYQEPSTGVFDNFTNSAYRKGDNRDTG